MEHPYHRDRGTIDEKDVVLESGPACQYLMAGRPGYSRSDATEPAARSAGEVNESSLAPCKRHFLRVPSGCEFRNP